MNSSIRPLLMLFAILLLGLAVVPAATHAAPPPPPPGATFQVLVTGEDRLVAATGCGVFEQPSEGAAWARIPGLEHRPIDIAGSLAIAAVPQPDGTSQTVLLRREAEGWQIVAGAPANPTAVATNLSGRRSYLQTGYGPSRLWRSDDDGRSWQQIYQTANQDVILDVAAAGPYSGRLNMVVIVTRGRQDSPRQVLRSLDSGATWRALPGDPAPTNSARLFVNYESSMVYVAGSGGAGMHLARLTDSSERLETVGLPEAFRGLPYGISALAAFRSNLVVAINVATNQSTLISTRQGAPGTYADWNTGLHGGISDIAYVMSSGEPTLIAATDDGIYRRAPGASAWSRQPSQPRGCAAEEPVPTDPFAPVPPLPTSAQRVFFPETGHTLSHEFKAFWEQHGGLPIFGYPLSEEFPERNADLDRVLTTQYLERERFEFHPENVPPYRVLLGRLGDELLKRQGRDWRQEDDLSNPFPNTACKQFDLGGERRQTCGPFLHYWETHGLNIDGNPAISYQESLALFGLPLTAPRMETNSSGDRVLTQWFERARFEYHPDKPAEFQVLLGRLGDEIARASGRK